ncbi:MAG: T9SS type A sorting domain-containing protein, partial [Bacteroidota bacterium]
QHEVLAFDEGYTGHDYRDYVQSAQDHNLVLVNGQGPGVPLSEWTDMDNTVFIENYFDAPSLDYAELAAWWQETHITRKLLFPDHRYLLMIDEVRGAAVNDYQYQLHGHGLLGASADSPEGAFVLDAADQSCLISRNGVHLKAKVLARGGASAYTSEVDTAYNGLYLREHSKLLVHKNEVEATEFVALLFPYTDEEGMPYMETLPVGAEQTALKWNSGTENHFALVQAKPEWTTMAENITELAMPIQTNGSINFWAFTSAGQWRSLFLGNGDSLNMGETLSLVASQKMNIALERMDGGLFAGYVQQPGSLTIALDSTLIVRSGAINDVEYSADGRSMTLHFEAPTHFQLEYGTVITTATALPESELPQIKLSPNPCTNWIDVESTLPGGQQAIGLELWDSKGRLLLQQKVEMGAGTEAVRLDVSAYPAGSYLLQLQEATRSWSRKIIVKK